MIYVGNEVVPETGDVPFVDMLDKVRYVLREMCDIT